MVARADDTFLSRHDMHKGAMTLIDADAAEALYTAMPPGQESSGGSAATPAPSRPRSAPRVAYLGKVANDQLGNVFRHDMTRDRRALPLGAAVRRRADRAVPDRGHAGRAAHDEHLSRRLRRPSARPTSTKRSSPTRPSPTSKAICSTRRRRRRRSAVRRPRRTRPGGRSRCRCPTRSASTGIARRSAIWSSRHVDILFANETEITSLYEENSFEAAAEARAPTSPWPR